MPCEVHGPLAFARTSWHIYPFTWRPLSRQRLIFGHLRPANDSIASSVVAAVVVVVAVAVAVAAEVVEVEVVLVVVAVEAAAAVVVVVAAAVVVVVEVVVGCR